MTAMTYDITVHLKHYRNNSEVLASVSVLIDNKIKINHAHIVLDRNDKLKFSLPKTTVDGKRSNVVELISQKDLAELSKAAINEFVAAAERVGYRY